MQTEKNTERSNRLKKYAVAAAGLTGVGLMLRGNGRGINKFLNDLAEPMEGVINDLSGLSRKEFTSSNISKSLNKRLLGEDSVFKKNRALLDNGYNVDYTTGATAGVYSYNSVKRDLLDIQNNREQSAILGYTLKLIQQEKDSLSDEHMGEMLKITTEALKKRNRYFTQESGIQFAVIDRFAKRLDGTGFEGDVDVISQAMETALNKSEELAEEARISIESIQTGIQERLVDDLIERYGEGSSTYASRGMSATVDEVIESYSNELGSKVLNNNLRQGDTESHDFFINLLSEIKEQRPEFGKVVLDKDFIMKQEIDAVSTEQGLFEIYSLDRIRNIKNAVLSEGADTIAGKLFNARSFLDAKNAPEVIMFNKGTFDKVIADALGSDTGVLKKDVFKVGRKFFSNSGEDGELIHLDKLDGKTVFSGNHGSIKVMYNSLFGNTPYRKQENPILSLLDIGTGSRTGFENFKSRFSKFNKSSTWIMNQYDKVRNEQPFENLYDVLEGVDDINQKFNTNARGVNIRTINEIKKIASKDSLEILNIVSGTGNVAENLLKRNARYTNENLTLLLNQFKKSATTSKEFMQIGSSAEGINVIKFEELINREAVKEVLISEANKRRKTGESQLQSYQFVSSRIRDMDLNASDKKTLNELFSWTIFQRETGTYAKNYHSIIDDKSKWESIDNIRQMMNSKSENPQTNEFFKDFNKGIKGFLKDKTGRTEVYNEIDNSVSKGFENNDYIVVGKTASPLDMLRDINENIKSGSGMFKQFTAGRNNPNDVTTATLLSYHMINRLTTPMETFGLGFSKESNGSTFDLIKNIGLKRIVPAVGIMHGLSYANYELRNITGTTALGSVMNLQAQATYGIKSVEQVIGFDDVRERARDYNPITQYLFGDYKDKDEYLDYIHNGYDEVRKGRWWSFGSSSEFRGGKISYFQPNIHRRIESNYEDISLYGSSKEKWKRSWLPSLRHPFSPIRAATNPYWLEEKHYWDRPYPVSGKLFGEGAPWSGPLNATIGKLIKPERRMHQDEMQGRLTDVRSIIADRNKEIMEKSTESRITRIDQSGFTPMKFAPESMPSLNEAVYSIRYNDGVLSSYFEGQDYAESLQGIENISFAENGLVQGGSAGKGKGGAAAVSYGIRPEASYMYKGMESDNVTNELVQTLATGFLSTGAVNSNEGLSLIGAINQDIKIRNPEARPEGALIEHARAGHSAYYDSRDSKKIDYLESFESVNNIGDIKSEFSDIAYSAKQLSGIYGFMFDSVVPESKSYKLENANMASFSRSFWDSSVGGAGGGFMEIARRFFPHENRAIERINNIKNTQPEWLPDKFNYGDPYTSIPKGEARLPGAGYEALNKLHPDSYGSYGAFDRYKILADVSPMTTEYKIWKQIAEETVTDPTLKKQMNQIEKRVKEQNKEHDFFNYKFIGTELEKHNAVIESVTNTGQFKIVGKDETFKLAGIKPLKDEEGESYVHQYLTPGMSVNIAYDKNTHNRKTKTGEVVALVNKGNSSVTREMYKNEHAIENEYKDTTIDEYFNLSEGNIAMGHIYEAIGHAPIPYLHNKFLRIDSSLESYKKEQVYGTNFATWDNPIEGFIKPAFESAFALGPVQQAVGLGASALAEYVETTGTSTVNKTMARAGLSLLNPAAFSGGMIGGLSRLSVGSGASKILNYKNGTRAGALIGITGYALANTHNPIHSALSFGALGLASNMQFKWQNGKMKNNKAALIGGAVGLGLSALKNPDFNWDRMTGKYIPKDTQKKWEIEEYYDRLKYYKYQKLYNIASRKAKQKEGVDVKKIITKFEHNREENDEKIEKFRKQIKRAEKYILDSSLKKEVVGTINKQIGSMLNQEQYFKTGEYTKSAIAYKKAMDNTVYGLNKYSSNADILRALPKYDRDFFMDFAKVKDPKERDKILNYVSPYKQKALKILWKEDYKEEESNYEYFKSHNLPGVFWSGWNPEVDLANVQMKTIENEGMLLSDFGMYDSSKSEPATIMAPEIQNFDSGTPMISLQKNVLSILSSLNLQNLDVSVEPSNNDGLSFITNLSRTASYNANKIVDSAFTTIF